jgi:hypothetical protein
MVLLLGGSLRGPHYAQEEIRLKRINNDLFIPYGNIRIRQQRNKHLANYSFSE